MGSNTVPLHPGQLQGPSLLPLVLVQVGLVEQGDGICITVADSGSGIAPEQMAAIFEPFFRADPSRQRASGGVGLGLALAAERRGLVGG